MNSDDRARRVREALDEKPTLKKEEDIQEVFKNILKQAPDGVHVIKLEGEGLQDLMGGPQNPTDDMPMNKKVKFGAIADKALHEVDPELFFSNADKRFEHLYGAQKHCVENLADLQETLDLIKIHLSWFENVKQEWENKQK